MTCKAHRVSITCQSWHVGGVPGMQFGSFAFKMIAEFLMKSLENYPTNSSWTGREHRMERNWCSLVTSSGKWWGSQSEGQSWAQGFRFQGPSFSPGEDLRHISNLRGVGCYFYEERQWFYSTEITQDKAFKIFKLFSVTVHINIILYYFGCTS